MIYYLNKLVLRKLKWTLLKYIFFFCKFVFFLIFWFLFGILPLSVLIFIIYLCTLFYKKNFLYLFTTIFESKDYNEEQFKDIKNIIASIYFFDDTEINVDQVFVNYDEVAEYEFIDDFDEEAIDISKNSFKEGIA